MDPAINIESISPLCTKSAMDEQAAQLESYEKLKPRQEAVLHGPASNSRSVQRPLNEGFEKELEARMQIEMDFIEKVGKKLDDANQNFLGTMVSIAIFGASTFISLVSPLADPVKFSLGTVRALIAVAWILFAAVLVLSILLIEERMRSTVKEEEILQREVRLLQFMQHEQVQAETLRTQKMSESAATKAVLILLWKDIISLLIVAAFLMLSLVVVAYSVDAGCVAVGLFTVIMVGGLIRLTTHASGAVSVLRRMMKGVAIGVRNFIDRKAYEEQCM